MDQTHVAHEFRVSHTSQEAKSVLNEEILQSKNVLQNGCVVIYNSNKLPNLDLLSNAKAMYLPC